MPEPAPIAPVPDEPKPFRKEGLGYVYEPAGRGIRIAVDFINRHRDELTGEILVETTLPGVRPHLHQARFNLSSTTARTSLSRHLASRAKDLDWDGYLETFCASVLRAERKGNPIVKVGRLDFGPEMPDTVERLLPSGQATQLFAPGKTGKGWVAWGLALGVETGTSFAGLKAQKGHVLYLDWEDNPKIANQRVQMVARGMGLREVPEIALMSMNSPLRLSVNELARAIDENGFTMLIIDSAQKAIGSADFQSPETGAALMFEALRQLGDTLTILIIDHTTKTDARPGAEGAMAYGSVMKTNWVRNVWQLKKDQEEGSKISHLGLFHENTNHSEKFPPIGLLLDFKTPGEVHIRRDAIAEPEKPMASMKVSDRLKTALRKGELHLAELAKIAETSQKTAEGTMYREPETFERLPGAIFRLRNQLRIVPEEPPFAPDDLPFFGDE